MYRGSFWGQKSLEQNKISNECFGMRTSNCPNFQKTSGTFVKTAFYLCKWSFWRESNFSRKYCFFSLPNKGRKIFDLRQSLLCTVGKTAFCVCRGQFWNVFWIPLISWTFLISEQEIFGNSTQKFWLCFSQDCILRVKTIFSSKKFDFRKLFIFLSFWNLIKKNFGLFTEKIRHGCPSCLLRM